MNWTNYLLRGDRSPLGLKDLGQGKANKHATQFLSDHAELEIARQARRHGAIGRFVPAMADTGNRMSVYISFYFMEGILKEAPGLDIGIVGSGQRFGSTLEGRLSEGLRDLVQKHSLGFLVASKADAKTMKPKPSFKLTDYWPYLTPPSRSNAEGDAQIYRALGRGHLIQPDVVIWRQRTMTFNAVKDDRSQQFSIETPHPFACISGKATIRSDRSQSSRYEGAALVRWRRARPPHIVVVTAEPFPSRLGSLAWGLGDLDAVYHVNVPALYDAVVKAQDECGRSAMRDAGSYDELKELIELARVRDLSQLFEDLFGEFLP